MKIMQHFIRDNSRIRIISNDGEPTSIPDSWQPVLPAGCEVLVAIPDMHMYIRNSNLDNFKFGAKTMLHFLKYLHSMKIEFDAIGKTLRIYQLGDLYELRFPGTSASGANANAAEIMLSHSDYNEIINIMNQMRTHFIYGNHDFELRHFPGFRFGAMEGKVYLEHGFAAVSWLANPSKPLWEPAQFVFLLLRSLEKFFNELLVANNVIDEDKHFAVGVPSGNRIRKDITLQDDYPEGQRDYYLKRLKRQRDNVNACISIIGHTHKPYFEANIDEGYIYVDAGAWTEGRSDFAVVTNEEIAICRYMRKNEKQN